MSLLALFPRYCLFPPKTGHVTLKTLTHPFWVNLICHQRTLHSSPQHQSAH